MSNLLGVIKAVIGLVYVVEADGSQRLLKEGDRIYSGEEIVTGDSGAVSVALPNGKTLDLGRNSHWSEHGLNAVNSAEHDTQDVASLQKSIADGADPTQALEATAAGNEPPVQIEGGGGGHTLVQLDLTGQVVDPTAGFNTAGLGVPTPELHLPEGGLATDFTSSSSPVLPPLIQINDFAGNDGFINKNEINHTPINGTSNQNHVTLVFTDSQKNTITIDVPVNNGRWTAQPDLSGLVEGKITVLATATDVSGRTATSTDDAQIDITGPVDHITIDSVTPDNIINIAESHQPQTLIHGNVSGDAKIGDKVTLTVDGKEYSDVVIDLGNGTLGYQINVSTQGLLANQNIHATVTSTDEAGNTTQASSDHHVDIDLDIHNSITIETVANDDVVNRAESRMPTLVTGAVGGDAQAGDPVTVTVQGQQFHGVVINDNGQLRYSVPVPTNLLREGANDVQVQVVSHDVAGNEAIAVEHKTVTLDTQAHNALTISAVADDNTVNSSESRMPTLISGTVSGDAQAGDHVVVSVNGQSFNSQVVTDENGHLRYTVPVPTSALTEGSNDVQVMITGVDAAGNTAIAVEHKTVVLDTQAQNALTIETVAGDDTVNATESRMPTMISGTVSGDAQAGDKVVVSVNGHSFNGQVVTDENGHLRYTVPVPTSALTEGSNDVQVMITGTDNAGNTAIAVETKTIVLDTQAQNGFTIETVAGDDTVNATESRMPTMISGTVSGDAHAGDHVVVNVNGQRFESRVTDDNGQLRYTVPVPTSALHEGSNDVQVMITGTDNAGNTAIAMETKTIVLDTQAQNGFTIETVAGDDTVNATESRMPTMISGTVSGDAHAGDHVVVNVNGQRFESRVTDDNGQLRYTVPVPTSALHEGSNDVQVMITGTDNAGNTAIAVETKTIVLDTQAHNALTIATVADDNTVNASESRMPTMISGTVSGDAQAGDKVVVSVNGHEYRGDVVADANGQLHYAVPVPTSALTEGSNDVQVMITGVDAAGNTAIAVETKTIVLDTQAHNALTIGTVAGDDTVNATESRMPTMISGTVSGDAQAGDGVVVSVNGHSFNGLVVTDENDQLHYAVPVPTSALTEGSNDVQVMITGVDASGNTAIAVETKTIVLDTQAQNGFTIETVAGDDTVNATESRMPTMISGTVSGDAHAGDHVVVNVNGQRFESRVTDDNGQLRYTVPVPTSALHEGSNDVQVMITGTDNAGNTAIAVETKTIVLDTQAQNSFTIETVAGDDTVNATESRMPTMISGTVSGDAHAGDHVVVNVNGQRFESRVTDDNGQLRYTVPVPTSALHEGSNDVQVIITGTDNAGNTAIAVETKTIVLDTQAHNALTIATVADDNTVNASESRMPTMISGTVSGDAQAGDKVVVSVNGHEYRGDVVADANGQLHYAVPVPTSALTEGSNDVQVMITGVDAAGNTAIAVETKTIVLDTQAHNALTIGTVADDNVVNATESRMPTMISGTVSGDAQAGDGVVVSVNGHSFNGLVVTDENGHLHYAVPVPTSALTEGSNDVQVMITGVDAAGNTAIAVETKTIVLDTQAQNALTIETVAGDDTVNATESRMPTMISGTVSGDAQAGDKVVVSVNGHEYRGEVVTDENGHLRYTVPVPTSALTEGSNDVQVMITGVDASGNTAIAVEHKTVVLDTQAQNVLTIETVAGDDTVNASESRMPTMISGTVSGDAQAGDGVVVSVNGHSFNGLVVTDENGHLHYAVPVPTSALTEGSNDVQVMITGVDAAGNTAIAVETKTIVLDTQAQNGFTIETVAGDDTVNATESRMPTMISGTVSGDAHAGDHVVVNVNGQRFESLVTDDNGQLRYTVPVPTSALHEGSNDVQVMITGTDNVGNTAIAVETKTIVLDTQAQNGFTIENVAGDDTVNATESRMPTMISGTVSGDAHAGDHVVVNVNGQRFESLVTDDNGQLRYTVPVPTSALTEGSNDVQVMITGVDAAGNTAIAVETKTIVLDTQAQNALTIETVAGDDTVNATESRMPTMISGTVSGDAQAGDKVVVSVNGHEYRGEVVTDENGQLRYTVPVPTSALTEGSNDVQVMITGVDASGNTAIAVETKTIVLDTQAQNALTIETVAGDDTVNATESRMPTMISGTVSGDAHAGDHVVVNVNGQRFESRVTDDNGQLRYTVPVPTSALHEGSNDVQVMITGTDNAGNTAIAVETKTIVLDTQAQNALTIETVSGDDTVNATESRMPTMISGTVSGDAQAGDKVVVSVNGHEYRGEVISDENGHLRYTVPVPTSALHEGSNDVQVMITGTDNAGNTAIAVETKTIVLDTQAQNTLTIETVAGDDTVNATESRMPTMISGTVSGDAQAGDKVVVSVNGHEYRGEVITDENGHLRYTVPVPTSALTEGSNDVQVMITGTDNVGNTAIAVEHKTVFLDTQAHNGLTISTVAGDDVVNHQESQHETLVTGHVSGKDAQEGDRVVVSVQGKDFTGEVLADADGHLYYQVAVSTGTLIEGHNDVQVMVISHDTAGNEAIAVEHKDVVLDTHADATIKLNDVTDDNVLNHDELNVPKQLVSGTVEGDDAHVGDVVSLNVNGKYFTGHVIDLGNGHLGYQIPVDSSAFSNNQGDVDTGVKVKATIKSHDPAGNEVIQTTEHTVQIDNTAHATINIGDVTQDNILNHDELSADKQTISGEVTGDAKLGDKVELVINGTKFTGEVSTLPNGHLGYSIDVNPGVFSRNKGEVDGSIDIHVKVTSHDAAGNEVVAHADRTVFIDNHANDTITVDAVTKDNVLNHSELNAKTQTITGTVGGDAHVGDEVVLKIGDKIIGQNTVVDLDGKGHLGYRIDVKPSDFSDNKGEVDKDVTFTATVTSHDQAGNTAIETTEHTVHIDNHANNHVTVETVAGDNTISMNESRMPTLISGVVTGVDAKAGDAVVVRVQGEDFKGKVVVGDDGQLRYEVHVPTEKFHDGVNDVKVTVTSHDGVGNTAHAVEHVNVTLDTQAHATISVDSVTSDNILNQDELANPKQLITGTVGGDAKAGDDVVIEINGYKYPGNVIDLGNHQLGYRIAVDTYALTDNRGQIDTTVKFTATVTSFDDVKNEVIQTTEHTVHIDNFAVANIDIGGVTQDNILNHDELDAAKQTVTGIVGGDAQIGDKVVLEINGTKIPGEVVELSPGQLGYKIDVDPAVFSHNRGNVDGDVNIHAKVTSHDAAGNEVVAHYDKTVHIDNHADATITIDAVTTDNVLNHAELAAGKQMITGTVGVDAKVGDEVVLKIGDKPIGTGHVVDLDGHGHLGYRIEVKTSDFSDNKGNVDKDVTFTASVTSHDAAHNEVTVSTEHTVHIDNHAYNNQTISTVAGDDVVNLNESHRETLITGHVKGEDAQPGDAVMVTVHGNNYPGTVYADANGHLRYSVAVPVGVLKEGSNDVQVKVTSHDAANNEVVSTEHKDVVVDTHADATLTIADVTKDNILNHDELAATKQFVHGTVGGDAQFGDAVDIEIGGRHFHGNVIFIAPGQLGYQVAVDPSAFNDNSKDVDGHVTMTVSVKVHDAAGNELTKSETHDVKIDNHADPVIHLDKVTGDDIINFTESQQAHTRITGTVSGDVHEGDKVIVTVHDHKYETTVIKLPFSNGALGYSVDVNTKDLMSDKKGASSDTNNDTTVKVTAHVVGYDAAGNEHPIDVTTDLKIDLKAEAHITINPIAGDNMINGDESKVSTTMISGTVDGDVKVGDYVHILVNGQELTTKVVSENGKLVYHREVSTHDLLADPNVQVTVTATDNANNTATAGAEQKIIIDTRVEATISVDSVTPDNTLNDEELNHHYTLVSGTVTGEVEVGKELTLKINGHEYHGTVQLQSDGSKGYNIMVETTDLHQDPNIHASIDVTDKALNHKVVTADHHVDIDSHADATVTINVVSGDDVLNGLDQKHPTTVINGVVTGDVKAGDFVHLTINGVTYDVKVEPQAYLGNKLGYSFEAKTSDLLANGHIVATVDAKDDAGNTVTAHADHDVSRDDSATATITIDPVTDDNTINNEEAHQGKTTITGHVTGDVHLGDVVDLTVNGQHYYGSVNDKGRYSIDVSTDDLISAGNKPVIHAEVTGYDAAGNTHLAEFDRVVNIDTRADVNFHDNQLGLTGNMDFYRVAGYVDGDAKVGDLVTITVGGDKYYTTVQKLPDGKLGYNTDHLIDPKTGLPDTGDTGLNRGAIDANTDVVIQVTSHDQYGNAATATAVIHPQSSGTGTGGTGHHDGGTTTPTHTDPHATITISPVAGDNTINEAESHSTTTVIRGTVVGDVHGGEAIDVYLGGVKYPGIVIERPNLPGEFSYAIPVDTQTLMQHPDITVKMPGFTDNAPQTTVTVDTDVSIDIQLDKIAGDDTINIVESQTGKTPVSGIVTGKDVHDGSNVTIMVNGHAITTQVFTDANGVMRFSKDVSINDLRQDPHVTVSVTGHDDHGNIATKSADTTVKVDTDIDASVTIDKVTPDNVINLNESHDPKTTITGQVGGDVHPGDKVTIHVNGVDYPDVTVDQNLHYSVDVFTSDLLKGDTITASVHGYDAAGNTIDKGATQHYTTDFTAEASITVNTVSGDNILSAKDLAADQTEISGTVGKDARVGDEVTVVLNGTPVHTTVIELPYMNGDLGYTMKVNTADLKAELDSQSTAKPHITVTVTGTDEAGNAFSNSEDQTITIDDHADVNLTLNNVSGDNVLNLAESHNPTTTISGSVTGDVKEGDTMVITVNGNDLTATLHSDGKGGFTFTREVNTSELLQDQHITYKVLAVDDVGNTQPGVGFVDIRIDQDAQNEIHFDKVIAGDNRVNIEESHATTTMLRGVVTGDAHGGDPITLTVNGQSVTGGVVLEDSHGNRTFEIPVANSVLKEGDNTVVVTVSGQDEAGNPATSTDTHTITLDTTITGSINIAPIATDNVINAKESQHIHVTGTVDGDAREGDLVTLNVNGHVTHTKVVTVDGHLGYDVQLDKTWLNEGENNVTVNVQIVDDAGNHLNPAYNQVVTLDTHADATITVNTVASDDVVNAREAKHLTVSGAVDGDAVEGDKVTLEINGHTITTDVIKVGDHLGYEVPVKQTWLSEGNNEIKVSVSVNDAAGNHYTTPQESHQIFVDTQIAGRIDIDKVAGDNVINAKESDHITVSGTVGLDAKPGDDVDLELNGHKITVQVQGTPGNLTYTTPVDKAWFNEGSNNVKVTLHVSDDAGNVSAVEHSQTITLDTQIAGRIDIDKVAGDNVINAKESDHITVSGTVGLDAKPGDDVDLELNGHKITVQVQGTPGHLTYTTPVDKAWFNEGSNDVKVTLHVSDDAGNVSAVEHSQTITLDTQIAGTIDIDKVTGDNVINAKESDHITISGTVGLDAKPGDDVDLELNGHKITVHVQGTPGHLTYTTPVDKAWFNEGSNDVKVTLHVSDDAGNTTTASHTQKVELDTHADATITIDKVTGDDHLDSQEARHHVTHITGHIDSADVQANEHINATINGKHYDAVLHDDNGHLTYDIPVDTHDLNIGKNSVDVSVIAHDNHGNSDVIHQKSDFTMDDPAHRGKHDVDSSDKSHHAATSASHDQGLSNLFDDSDDSLSFNLHQDGKVKSGEEDHKVFTGKEGNDHGKVDLSDLAHELHHSDDITQLIKGADSHHDKVGSAATAATPAHHGDASAVPQIADSYGSSTHSLDHLIPKPEHYHS
ncbi:retention module-containing protein [Buttiauxella gaviniae]|uniref:Retention module-containing protein n=1 Tax=Buttiauxella gaviniae TaxID=82990 RepID=A0ABV3NRK6_9ENTR